MIIDSQKLEGLMKAFPWIVDCQEMSNGALRVATPLQYANGSLIDVFIQADAGLFSGYTVSDRAQTAVSLLNMHIDIQATKKRRQIVQDICDSLDTKEIDSNLTVFVEQGKEDQLPDAIMRVAQAALRVSDLVLTQRFPASIPFKDEVEEFLAASALSYEPDQRFTGKYGKDVTIDFMVHGRSARSLIRALSTGNPATAHVMMNELLACWVDLDPLKERNRFITVIDDRRDTYRPPDLARISGFSHLYSFPSQQDLLKEALTA